MGLMHAVEKFNHRRGVKVPPMPCGGSASRSRARLPTRPHDPHPRSHDGKAGKVLRERRKFRQQQDGEAAARTSRAPNRNAGGARRAGPLSGAGTDLARSSYRRGWRRHAG